ncbi:MAG: CPBP family intramembrane metalloprotease [Lachnospiraceae bacterium]|nr:CPBP family intramembrane metalloprotease [Lachnospiraceae bacterium]
MNKKKDLTVMLVFLFFAFAPLWIAAFAYYGSGHVYEDSGTQLLCSAAMLCPTVSVFITGAICKEKIDFVGENSLKLGIYFKDKKWIWMLVAIFLPWVYKELGGWLFLAFNPECFDAVSFSQELGMDASLIAVMPLYSVVNAVVFSIGGLGEEIGWRGFMMPRLEKKMGIGPAILVGGIIWGVWHYPINYYGHNFGTGYWGEPWLGFLIFTIFTITDNALLTLVVKKTNSVLLAAFMHAVGNGAIGISAMFLNPQNLTGFWAESTVQFVIMMGPSLVFGIIAYIWLIKLEKKERVAES